MQYGETVSIMDPSFSHRDNVGCLFSRFGFCSLTFPVRNKVLHPISPCDTAPHGGSTLCVLNSEFFFFLRCCFRVPIRISLFQKLRSRKWKNTLPALKFLVFSFFSSNGYITIKTQDPYYQHRIGNAQGLSFRDIQLANLMYNCAGEWRTSGRREGYQPVHRSHQCARRVPLLPWISGVQLPLKQEWPQNPHMCECNRRFNAWTRQNNLQQGTVTWCSWDFQDRTGATGADDVQVFCTTLRSSRIHRIAAAGNDHLDGSSSLPYSSPTPGYCENPR